jgi:small-conductance mechanosensitive channel
MSESLARARLVGALSGWAITGTGIAFTIGLAAEVLLVLWGSRRLLAWIETLAAERVGGIESEHLRSAALRHGLQLVRMMVRLLATALILVGLFAWVTALLDLLPATHDVAGRLEHSVADQLIALARATLAALPGLGVIGVIYFVARTFHEALNNYFVPIERAQVTSTHFDEVTAETTRRLAVVGLWIAAVIVAYPYFPGSESAVFKGITVLLGLMLSLGSSNLVGQLISGLVMIYNRTLRPGDFIVTPEIEGTVDRVGLFSCSVRTVDEVVVTVPNSKLSDYVRNHSRARPDSAVRHFTTVTIGYDTPWPQVHELLLAAAGEVADVRKSPAPYVRQAALEDFYVRYELVYAPADPRSHKRILSDVLQAIQNRFHAAGVQIMSPHYLGDPAKAKIPPAVK